MSSYILVKSFIQPAPELLDFLISLYVVLAILEKLRAEKHSYLPLANYGKLCQSLLEKESF